MDWIDLDEELPASNSPTPSSKEEAPVRNHALDVPFRCSSCGARIFVPEKTIQKRNYASHCHKCQHTISISLLYNQDDLEVIELLGCEYGGVSGTIQTSRDNSPLADLHERTLFDGLTSEWELRKKNGETLRFDSIAAVRKWIQEGKIRAGDEIVASTDRKVYRIENYPGTADLFGNAMAGARERLAMTELARPLPVVQKRRNLLPFLYGTVGLALVVASPFFYRSWRLQEGQRFVTNLIAGVPREGPAALAPTILNARDYLRRGTPEQLPSAAREFTRALAISPSDAEALGGLIEVWTEIGKMTSSPSDLARAGKLLDYAVRIQGAHPAILQARARYLWRSGETEDAADLLEGALEKDPNLPELHALAARVQIERNELTRAALHIQMAMDLDPFNSSHLLTFADLMERQDKLVEAAEYVRRARELSTDPGPLSERIAQLYRKAGDLEEAEAVYRNALARGENPEGNRFGLIEVFHLRGMHQEVLDQSQLYFADFPEGAFADEVRSMQRNALSRLDARPAPSPEPFDPSKKTTRHRRRR